MWIETRIVIFHAAGRTHLNFYSFDSACSNVLLSDSRRRRSRPAPCEACGFRAARILTKCPLRRYIHLLLFRPALLSGAATFREIPGRTMNIGRYSFGEFKKRAADFHGYPAPGLLLGGYMVAAAQRRLPEGTLFEALVETTKCLPDAVQLLTPCSTGNNRMKVINLGRFALSLFDKRSGEGFRACLDPEKLGNYPEIAAWFLKKKAKQEQDEARLLKEIEAAGDRVCSLSSVRMLPEFLGHAHMGAVAICPHCGEAFPERDGMVCRACRGETPYASVPLSGPGVSRIPRRAAARFAAEAADGKAAGKSAAVGAEAFARRMAGANVAFSRPSERGEIVFRAEAGGLLCLDKKRLETLNMTPGLTAACRRDGTLLERGTEFARARIPAPHPNGGKLAAVPGAPDAPLFSVAPLRRAGAAVLAIGTEPGAAGFIPHVSAKLRAYGCAVLSGSVVPDDKARIAGAVTAAREAGADLLVIGSVGAGFPTDPAGPAGPADVTGALAEAGMRDLLHGAPVFPGTAGFVGRITDGSAPPLPLSPLKGDACVIRQPGKGEMQVAGVSAACVLHFKVTLFDVLLPRLLAGRVFGRADLAVLGDGGFCAGCRRCTWPKCFFAV
jgi:formylmethanofuran dehydrogenase subunit E